MTTTRFSDPFFDFAITRDDKWCCYWPRKGGWVLQDADGYGNSLGTAPPASSETCMAWIAPSEPKVLLLKHSSDLI